MNYYLDIKIRNSIDVEQTFVREKLFQFIHAFITDKKLNNGNENLALSFPFLGPHSTNDLDSLNFIRIFSDKDSLLTLFISENLLKNLKKRKAITLSEIRNTPQTNKYVSFIRNRSVEKNKKNGKPNKGKDFLFYIKLESKANGNSFSFFIEPSEANELSNKFSKYGLCTSKEQGVPWF